LGGYTEIKLQKHYIALSKNNQWFAELSKEELLVPNGTGTRICQDSGPIDA
jgi:hypothetical protein